MAALHSQHTLLACGSAPKKRECVAAPVRMSSTRSTGSSEAYFTVSTCTPVRPALAFHRFRAGQPQAHAIHQSTVHAVPGMLQGVCGQAMKNWAAMRSTSPSNQQPPAKAYRQQAGAKQQRLAANAGGAQQSKAADVQLASWQCATGHAGVLPCHAAPPAVPAVPALTWLGPGRMVAGPSRIWGRGRPVSR